MDGSICQQLVTVANENGFTVLMYEMLREGALSPVRSQAMTHACGHICGVEAVEILFRLEIANTGSLFFDVQDCFNNTHMACPNLFDSFILRRSLDGSPGTPFQFVRSYIEKHGLKVSDRCMDPVIRSPLQRYDIQNLCVEFDIDVPRYGVRSFPQITSPNELFLCAGHCRIVAGVIPYESLGYYRGPSYVEVANKQLI